MEPFLLVCLSMCNPFFLPSVGIGASQRDVSEVTSSQWGHNINKYNLLVQEWTKSLLLILEKKSLTDL